MKKNFLSLIAVAFLILICGSWSWAQCPEDPFDRGECDTLNVICLDCEQTPGSGPYFVRFPLLVTHDQTEGDDSIGGFVIPLAWTRTNPSAYCSVTAYWNNTKLFPSSKRVRSIFRHMEISPGDTMFNRMMSLSELEDDLEWDTFILNLDDTSHFWLTMVPMSKGVPWWEGDRTLLATITFRIEDTMHVCIDSTFWPPTSRLTFSRLDGQLYIPRHNLPHCFKIGPAPPPDFTIELEPDTLEVQVGNSVNCDVILTSLDGFASSCTLTISGLPPDASASFDPNPVVPTDTSDLQINTAVTTPAGTYTALVIASEMDKGIVDTAELVLTVTPPPDFTIALEPDTQEVQAGNSVDYDVILTSLFGFSSPCTLTVTGLPDDASADFDTNPATPTDTSVMTVTTEEITPPGTYNLTITATEQLTKAKIVHDTTVVLIVTPPPDFTIEVKPDTLEVQAGDSVSCDVILTSLYGFAFSCSLTATGLPDDASAVFDPNPVIPTDTSTLQISTTEATPSDTHTITVTASQTDKGIVHSAELVLIVTPPPDFTIEASPETLEVSQGGEGSYEVILTSLYGFDSPCTLTVSGLPDDASGEFDPDTLVPTNTSTLTISVAETTPMGTCTLTITGTELVPPSKNQVERSVDVVLIVRPPEDFAIEVFPDFMFLPRGHDSSYTVVLESISGFNSPCSLRVTGLPELAVGTFVDSTLVPTDTTELNIFVPDIADTGTYTITITATEMEAGKAIQHSEEVTLVVTIATWAFYIDVDPDTQKVVVGDSTTYQVTMIPYTGFTAPCTLLSIIESSLPPGVTFHFDPEVILPDSTSILTIVTTGSTPAGIYELIIKGWANPRFWATTTAILMVQDFSISVNPDSQNVTQGHAVGYVVRLDSLFGFDDPCTLLVSGLPDPPDSGVFDQAILVPTNSTTLNVYTTSETDTGRYVLTITARRMTGTKPPLVLEHSFEVVLRVEAGSDAGDWADDANAPKSFTLFQNQPNPFNPETQINYYLPRACQVRLTIYNVLGQRVRTLFDGHQDTGMHTLLWDGRGEDGAHLSSGIYFYRLQAENFQETKKMTLMK